MSRSAMGALLRILGKLLLIAVLAVLTLGFGVFGLCSAAMGKGGETLLGLGLIGIAVLFGARIVKLVRSIWRQIKGPEA